MGGVRRAPGVLFAVRTRMPERDTVARGSKPRGALAVVAPLAFLAICLLGWWATTSATGIEAWRLPSPAAVAARAVQLAHNPQTWSRAAVTGGEALAGCAIGTAVALPLAYVVYRSRLVSAAVEPFLGATQALPAIAIAPIVVLWTGYGPLSVALLCALMVSFPILVSSVVGLRHIDPELLEAAALDGASGATMALTMELPLAAHSILGGLRNGFTLSVTGAVVGEMVMGGTGLGQVLVQMRTNVDTAGMFVVIALLCLMATVLYAVIYRVERSRRYDTTR